MKWQKTKLMISNFVGFLIANPLFAYLIFGAILFFVIFISLNNCRSREAQRKDEIHKQNIEQTKGKVEVLTEQKEKQEQKVNEANQQLIEANSNFNRVIKRDSSGYNSNFSAVRQKFCSEFPTDSRCK